MVGQMIGIGRNEYEVQRSRNQNSRNKKKTGSKQKNLIDSFNRILESWEEDFLLMLEVLFSYSISTKILSLPFSDFTLLETSYEYLLPSTLNKISSR